MPALLGKPRYNWLTSFPSTLPVLVTSYDTVIAVSKRLAGPPGDVCAGDEITGGADMVAVALPETVDVPFMVPLAWPVLERVPVAFPGAAVGAADLAAVPEALCAAEDAATDVAMGAGGLAADAVGFGVANEAWLAAARGTVHSGRRCYGRGHGCRRFGSRCGGLRGSKRGMASSCLRHCAQRKTLLRTWPWGAGGLAADAAGFGVANKAWLAVAPEPEADAFAGTARLPDPLLMLKPL